MSDTSITSLYPQHLDTVKNRFEHILSDSSFEHAVIFSGVMTYHFLDDREYPFKTTAHFQTWLPVLNNPNCFVVYTPGEKPVLIYYCPVDYWYSVAGEPNEFWAEHFDIKMTGSLAEAKQYLPSNQDACAVIAAEQQLMHDWGFKHVNPDSVIAPLHWHRAYKTEYELACIRQANHMAAKAHQVAEASFRAGKSEREIHYDYIAELGCFEYDLPYTNIIGLNENGAVLHYTHMSADRLPKQKIKSMLIDCGAEYLGYCSDITRTYAYSEGLFADMVLAFDSLQLAIVDEMHVGQSYVDLHLNAHHKIAQFLQDFNIIHVDADQAVETGLSSIFYPHGLGHFLGLQTHDVGGHYADVQGSLNPPPELHQSLRTTRVIEPKQVFTIEPGAYFIEPLLQKVAGSKAINWDKVDGLRPYGGIRIEDNVVMHEDRVENMTRDAQTALV